MRELRYLYTWGCIYSHQSLRDVSRLGTLIPWGLWIIAWASKQAAKLQEACKQRNTGASGEKSVMCTQVIRPGSICYTGSFGCLSNSQFPPSFNCQTLIDLFPITDRQPVPLIAPAACSFPREFDNIHTGISHSMKQVYSSHI